MSSWNCQRRVVRGVQMNDAPVVQKNGSVLARGSGIRRRLETIPAQQCEKPIGKEAEEGKRGNQACPDSTP